MKITICGSIFFYDEMLETKKELENLDHKVKLPPNTIKDKNGKMLPVKEYYKIRKTAKAQDSWIWDRKEEAMRKHFDKVVWADAILVLNYSKNKIDNYLGPNTLLEMGLAFHLRKKIYLLNEIPDILYKEEILAMKPIILYNNLSRIK